MKARQTSPDTLGAGEDKNEKSDKRLNACTVQKQSSIEPSEANDMK